MITHSTAPRLFFGGQTGIWRIGKPGHIGMQYFPGRHRPRRFCVSLGLPITGPFVEFAEAAE